MNDQANYSVPEDSPKFEVGDFVIDTDQEDSETAVVLQYRRDIDGDLVPSWAAPISDLDGKTVNDLNPNYPMNDSVVRVSFVDHLDSMVGDRWRKWSDENEIQKVFDYVGEWNIPLKTYEYPESRLAVKP